MSTTPQQPAAVPYQAPEDMEAKLQSMMATAREEATREGYQEVTTESLVGSDEERPDTGDELIIYRFAERDVEAGIPAVSKLKVNYRMTVGDEKTYIVSGSYKSANYRNSRRIGNNILIIRVGTVVVFTGRGGINLKHASHPALIFVKKATKSLDQEVQAAVNTAGSAANTAIQ